MIDELLNLMDLPETIKPAFEEFLENVPMILLSMADEAYVRGIYFSTIESKIYLSVWDGDVTMSYIDGIWKPFNIITSHETSFHFRSLGSAAGSRSKMFFDYIKEIM